MTHTTIVRHFFNRKHAFGGMCVITHHVKGDSFFTIQTSACSRQDQYVKKFGYELAKITEPCKIVLPYFENKNKISRNDLINIVKSMFKHTFEF